MGIKTYNPYTPSRRNMTGSDFSEITKTSPEKSLCVSLKKNSGRNNQGKITVRHRGGGSRRKYRVIDFKRYKDGIPATVIGIEYDPNRTANIALICYEDGTKSYILAPEGLTDGMKVMNGAEAEVRVGNCLPLSEIPVGTQVHNIELYPGKGGQLVRSAGNSAQLMAKEGKYATLRLPSGEMRMVPLVCRATVGVVGNVDHSLVKIGKAGRKRHMGIRPTVRGSVMNPNDHPQRGSLPNHQHRRQSRLRSDDSGQNGSGIQGLRQRHRHLLQNGSRKRLGTDAQIHRERNGLLPAARRCSQPELGLLQLEHGVRQRF